MMQDLELLLLKDVKAAAANLSLREIRYLVDTYYSIQEFRKSSGNQTLALSGSEEPCEFISWVSRQMNHVEKRIKSILDYWTRDHDLSRWARSIIGIGEVLSSGLAAHINMEPWRCAQFIHGKSKKPCKPEEPHGGGVHLSDGLDQCGYIQIKTAGQIWRFAGLDPTSSWEKGHRRPWNAALKVLCWKIGESFVKVSGNPESLYGRIYLERKQQEVDRNEVLAFKEQAEHVLATKNIGKSTEAYKWYSQGKLPPGHLHARAKRYAVKLFLSHYFEKAYLLKHGKQPPLPYIIAIKGHQDYISSAMAR